MTTVDVSNLSRNFLAKGAADAVIILLQVICQCHIGEAERMHATNQACRWFLNLAEQMGIEGAKVTCYFENLENGTARCVYTPVNEKAHKVKEYLLQCELARELDKG